MHWESPASECPLVTRHLNPWPTPWPAQCPLDHSHSPIHKHQWDRSVRWQLRILPCPWSCPWNLALPGLPPLSPSREEPRPGLPESPERLLAAWLEKWKQMKLTDKCPGLWQRPLTGGRLAVGGLMETDPDGSGMRRWITLMELRRGRMLRRHYSKIIWFLFVFLWGGGRDVEPHSPWSFFLNRFAK